MQRVLVTGSCGLIGSEVAGIFGREGFSVIGVDNNQRAIFFGPDGDTSWALAKLKNEVQGYSHYHLDIRDRSGIDGLIKECRPDVIVHAAAQPSHDRAAAIPFDDFDTNAVGTMNLLEATRRHCPESVFIHMSTNKVYGDRPNSVAIEERESRWEFADPLLQNGISESFPIDQSTHSLFGASKLAADLLVQEYGRYFGIATCCLRGGCLTGPSHSGVELHGFLSYLIKANLEGREYRVFGYKGKQVRDNIHSEDVARFMLEFVKAPRVGEVYNIGGGRDNSCSILEAFGIVEQISGIKMRWQVLEENRVGDHICYYSDLTKARLHYPNWNISKSLVRTIEEIVLSWKTRLP